MNLEGVLQKKWIAVSAATVIMAQSSLMANMVELNEVKVTSAAGYEQKITDAPASISVVTKEELTKRSFTNLLDAVREIEGVDIGETRDKTGQGTVSIRGMGGDYTLLLIDGKRQNNVGDLYPNSFGGNQQNHMPPLEMIERIEVIRGPMATLYGADAIGGVINVITKKISNEWTTGVTLSKTFQSNDIYGEDRTVDFTVMGPLIKDKLGVALRVSKYEKEESNPVYESITDPDGVEIDRTLGFGGGGRTVGNENYNIGARLAYRPHPKHELVFDIETSRQRYDNSESQLGTLDGLASIWRSSNTTFQPARVGYAAEQKFERDQWSLMYEGDWDFAKTKLNVYQVDTANLGRSLPFTVGERSELRDLWEDWGRPRFSGSGHLLDNAEKAYLEETFLPREARIMETRQLTVDGKVDIPFDNHLVILGFQYIDAEMEDGVFGMSNGTGYEAGTVQPHKQWALFAEENWYMNDEFTLTLGGRYDKHDVFGSNVSPRIYGVYAFNDSWTLKGGVGTGYKTPKTSDLFDGITGFGAQGTNPFIGNPDLTPEKSINKEVALYYTNQRNDSFNITYFQNDFKDKIMSGESLPITQDGWDTLGLTYTQKVNIAKAVIKGVEIAGKYNINDQFAVRGNYTYIDSEQKSGEEEGLPLTDNAKEMYNAAVDWKPNAHVSTYVILTGERERFRGTDANDNPLYYKNYNVVNAGASFKANEQLIFNVRVNNLLDRDFTTYSTTFTGSTGNWTPAYLDDYNTKAKSREIWLSMNLKF
jgi:outer membrane receptor for ferrienterochelin and colicins